MYFECSVHANPQVSHVTWRHNVSPEDRQTVRVGKVVRLCESKRRDAYECDVKCKGEDEDRVFKGDWGSESLWM